MHKTMARLTVSLPEELAQSAAARAATEKRSASSYVALLIERDVAAHGPASPELQEFFGKVRAAHAANPTVVKRLDAELHRATRHRRKAA